MNGKNIGGSTDATSSNDISSREMVIASDEHTNIVTIVARQGFIQNRASGTVTRFQKHG